MDKDQSGILVFVRGDGDEVVGHVSMLPLPAAEEWVPSLPVQVGEGSGRGGTLTTYGDIRGLMAHGEECKC